MSFSQEVWHYTRNREQNSVSFHPMIENTFVASSGHYGMELFDIRKINFDQSDKKSSLIQVK